MHAHKKHRRGIEPCIFSPFPVIILLSILYSSLHPHSFYCVCMQELHEENLCYKKTKKRYSYIGIHQQKDTCLPVYYKNIVGIGPSS